MATFQYSATDRIGKPIEGAVDATDMLQAAEQIRRMGYNPTRVELAASEAVGVGATPSSLTATASWTPSGLTPGVPARQMPMDLTQPIVEMPAAANAYSLTGEEVLPDTTVEMGRLEPWQRGGTPEPTANAPVPLDPTQAMPVASTRVPGAARGVERPRAEGIPYVRGKRVPVSFFQRLQEIFIFPIISGVVLKDIVPFYQQFATLINAGLSMHQALVGLEANTTNAKLKEIARQGQRQVQAGGRFSDVMAVSPWIFPPMHVELVRAAETGGMLDQVLRQLASYVEHDLEIKRLISRETLYPKIVLFVALMILGRPGFFGGTMSIVGLILGQYTGAQYFNDTLGFLFLLLFPIFALYAVYRLFLFNVPGIRESLDAFKMAIPVLGKLVSMFAIAKFMRTYAALYRGGFGMPACLEISGDASGNAVVRRAGHVASRHAERGGLASDALRAAGFFPPMAIDMFRTGETTGSLDMMLDKVADYYESEGKLKSHQWALIFSMGLFLLVAVLVGFQVVSFYMAGNAATNAAMSEGR